MDSVVVIDTPEGIAAFRILALKGKLKLECKGIRMSRGRTAYSVVKQEFGFKGSREKVLAQLEAWVESNLMAGK